MSPPDLALASGEPDTTPDASDDLVGRMPGPAFRVGRDGGVVAANERAEPLLALLRSESNRLTTAVIAALRGHPTQERLQTGEGKLARRFDITVVPHGDGVLVSAREATSERRLIAALSESRSMFKDLVLCSSDFAWQTDPEGVLDFVSTDTVLGYDRRDLVGQPASMLLQAVAPDGNPNPFRSVRAVRDEEIWLKGRDGKVACMRVNCLPVHDEGGAWLGTRGMCRDVTLMRQQQERLDEAMHKLNTLSRTDELTGLMNRRAFGEDVGRRIQHHLRHGRSGAMMYLDIDNFKPVNDIKGHAAGDAAIRSFGRFLTKDLRSGDLAARIGGDEFALWLEECDLNGARARADRLLASAAAILLRHSASKTLPLTLSVGVAMLEPEMGETFEDLLARSDAAMYAAKTAGKGRIHFAEPPKPWGDTAC